MRLFALAICFLPGAFAAQTTFEFHSSFWVNLHHVLYNQAAGKNDGRLPDLTALTPAETAAWNEALSYYESDLAHHEFLEFRMILIDHALSTAGNSDSLYSADMSPGVI